MKAQYHLFLEENGEALSLDINIKSLRINEKGWAENIKIPLRAIKTIGRLTDYKIITGQVSDDFSDLDHYL